MTAHSNDAPYCPLPLCKKLETFNNWFPRNVKKPQFLTLIPLNPQIKSFVYFGPVTFFTLLPPNFMQNLAKLMSGLGDI